MGTDINFQFTDVRW